MDSDDDYLISSSPREQEPPPSTHGRKLKRLKKASARVFTGHSPPPSPPLPTPQMPLDESEDRDFKEADEPSRSKSLHEISNADGENDFKIRGSSFNQDLSEAVTPWDNEPVGSGVGRVGVLEEQVADLGFRPSENETENHHDGDADESNPFELPGSGAKDDGNLEIDGSSFDRDHSRAKRGLEFDSLAEEMDGSRDGRSGEETEETGVSRRGSLEKGRENPEEVTEKKKKKRGKDGGDEERPKPAASNKRREEKERREYLKQLHADSQRLLRETRDASFKPTPIVRKPASSLLEKIRKRKLEVLEKAAALNRNYSAVRENNMSNDFTMDHDTEFPRHDDMKEADSEDMLESEDASKGGLNEEMLEHQDAEEGRLDENLLQDHVLESRLKKEMLEHQDAEEGCLDEDMLQKHAVEKEDMLQHQDAERDQSDEHMHKRRTDVAMGASHLKGSTISTRQSSPEIILPGNLNETTAHAFRPPLDDTQDLSFDTQACNATEDLPKDQHDSPFEEVLAPSLLTMNLKLDSAPPDDVSTDDEDDEKLDLDHDLIGDPVKAFVDDEAEEEDDSDNDLRFKESDDDEDIGELEEFIDLIATEDEEKERDIERRNELHQKWLEQQDAAGTENLLQRLNYGANKSKPSLKIDAAEEDVDELHSEDDKYECASLAKINMKEIKKLIPLTFNKQRDPIEQSDDEETEEMLFRQLKLEKAEKRVALLPLTEDESSREVMDLIKKVDPSTKKKAKASSFFDSMLTSSYSNSSSKSSFLGRMSHQSVSLSNKPRSSSGRSFVFGRDDSNSRSAVSVSEDSSEKTKMEGQRSKNASAKFVSSQSKSSTQSKVGPGAGSGTSLFEILKRSSTKSSSCSRDKTAALTETVYSAFKCATKLKVDRTKLT